MSSAPDRNVRSAARLARSLGYRVREVDLPDAGVMLDVDGFGELVELHYAPDPTTGFLRWRRAYVHRDSGRADVVRTWRDAREWLAAYAADG